MRAVIKISKKNLKNLKRAFIEKSQKSAILTKNGPKSIFLPIKDTFIRLLVEILFFF
jgi:hypothetical protein